MQSINLEFPGNQPASVTLQSLSPSTATINSQPVLAGQAFLWTGAAWSLSFNGTDPSYAFTYLVTWSDGSTTPGDGVIGGGTNLPGPIVVKAGDLLPAITGNAIAPASATNDGGSATQHPLPDQIAADRYAKSSNAMNGNPANAMRIVKLIPGNAADITLGFQR